MLWSEGYGMVLWREGYGLQPVHQCPPAIGLQPLRERFHKSAFPQRLKPLIKLTANVRAEARTLQPVRFLDSLYGRETAIALDALGIDFDPNSEYAVGVTL
jgi:hypothetical protein